LQPSPQAALAQGFWVASLQGSLRFQLSAFSDGLMPPMRVWLCFGKIVLSSLFFCS
jgi:hypothetical protein